MTVSFAAEAGQLQLNAFEPVIAHILLQNSTWLRRAVRTLRINCVDGIQVNRENLERQVSTSVGVVTALMPQLGYLPAAKIAKEALRSGRSIRDLVLEDGRLTEAEIDKALDPTDLSGGIFDTGAMPALTPELIAQMEKQLDDADVRDQV